MNHKRFTLKLLGVFLMETLNINLKEARKTLWHIVFGAGLLIVLWRLPDLIVVLK